MGSNKAKRREASRKKAKRRKILVALFCSLVVLVAVALVVFFVSRREKTETYSAGGQTVHLYEDGRFSAALAHNVQKAGTYTKTEEEGVIIVEFNTNGVVEIGWIENNTLLIPETWDDLHSHGRLLPRT